MGAELRERGNGGWEEWATTAFLYNLILFNYKYMLLLINNKQIQMFKSIRSVTAFSALLGMLFCCFTLIWQKSKLCDWTHLEGRMVP